MKESFAVKSRRLLIRIGKILPFSLCFIVFMGYTESAIALVTHDFLLFDNNMTLNTPVSFWIAKRFTYDWLMLFVILVISIAIETCKWNKIAILYLGGQLCEKDMVVKMEMEETTIFVIIFANLIISAFLVYKGVRILINTK